MTVLTDAADTGSHRRTLGAWATPVDLVAEVVSATIDATFVSSRSGRSIRVLDPACGDGRFLDAAAAAIERAGGRSEMVGVDIDPAVAEVARRRCPDATIVVADALDLAWSDAPLDRPFDVVIGNPPYLSQLAADTTRGSGGRFGAGTYGDAAVDFLGLAAQTVRQEGGRVAFVLPQSVLASRDAAEVRALYDRTARMFWSSWTGTKRFDADVHTCALAFEFGPAADRSSDAHAARATAGRPSSRRSSWSSVVTASLGIPTVPEVGAAGGRLGDRARLNANFRDEYYGMAPAVDDHSSGPPLVTTGLIDPATNRWGRRGVRFAGRRLTAPRVDLAALDERMQRWAAERLVPKILVANQTRIVEAWADAEGAVLPAVPVVAVYPHDEHDLHAIAALLTSPFASAWVWGRAGGTGLSATSVRVGPRLLADLPWPSGSLDDAIDALRDGDIERCGRLVDRAYGVDDETMFTWWTTSLRRILRRD